MTARRTTEEIIEIVESLGYEFIDEYVKKNYRRVIIKDFNGYKYDVHLDGLIRCKNPEFVSKSNPFVLENISLWLEINNKTFRLTEENVYLGSDKKLFFSCDICPEEFDSTWNSIYSQGTGCPFCSGHRLSDLNRLSILFPDIAFEWHPTKNGYLTSYDVSYSSNEKAWWICKEGHEWDATIDSRVRGNSCSYCSGQRVSDRNRLSLHYPEIASEWHPTKNGNLTPDDVSYGMTKKVWWICEEGHEWEASISHRTNGARCPKCKNSRGEKKISSFLKEFNITHIPECKFKSCVHKKELPFDFAIFDSDGYLYCIIEYHGIQHYEPIDFFGGEKAFRELQIRDKIKQKYCEDNNIPLKIIPYWDFDNIEQILERELFGEM